MKHRLRTEMKAALAAMTPAEAEQKSGQACRRVLELDEFDKARSVMLYAPIAGEVNCRAIAAEALRLGKTVLLPRVKWSPRDMAAVPVGSLDEPLVSARHGLREPAGEPWPIERIDLIIVPALAYDRLGNRLGRGGGFYDRFLAKPGLAAHTCGLAFSVQVASRIPVHPNDYPVRILVTDTEVLRFGGNGDGLGGRAKAT